MRAEYHQTARGCILYLVDKFHPARCKALNDDPVVDYFLAHVDGFGRNVEQCIDSIDGSLHARTKTAWLAQ